MVGEEVVTMFRKSIAAKLISSDQCVDCWPLLLS